MPLNVMERDAAVSIRGAGARGGGGGFTFQLKNKQCRR